MSVLTSQKTVEWYTPPDIIERARQCLGGIDLDPASSDVAQQWIQATTYYTAETPLQAAWAGRVWLNPPFDDTPTRVARLEREYTHGNVTAALLLVNSAPGYGWWERLVRRRPTRRALVLLAVSPVRAAVARSTGDELERPCDGVTRPRAWLEGDLAWRNMAQN